MASSPIGSPLRLRHGLVVALLLLAAAGCDGSNLFRGTGPDLRPEPEESFREQVLRYLEEGSLLFADEDRIRFRWIDAPVRAAFADDTPPRERDAFRRAAELIALAGGPSIVFVSEGGDVSVDALPPDAFRALDPNRPWSFGRTFVTSTPDAGIHGAEVFLSLEQPQSELERTALHALGHVVGIMGHPGFPSDRFVMASRAEGGPAPTVFDPVEREALRFLYSPGVFVGMTRSELRARFADWTT